MRSLKLLSSLATLTLWFLIIVLELLRLSVAYFDLKLGILNKNISCLLVLNCCNYFSFKLSEKEEVGYY